MKIELNNLSHIYDLQGIKTHALEGINLKLADNSISLVMGKSGMGKTTLLNCIAGLLNFSTGSILVDNFELAGATEEELSNYRLKTIGIMFQEYNLAPFLSIKENVQFPLIISGKSKSERNNICDELLKRFGILQYSNRMPNQLSGGERQRVALCVALANDPPIIIADEPTGALDVENSKMIYEYFEKIHKDYGKTIIIASHDLMCKKYVNNIYLLSRNQIIIEK